MSRRAGGRAARIATRQAAPVQHPCLPGQRGGQYRPLSDSDLKSVHQTSLRILDEIGMGQVPPLLAEQAVSAGARMNDKGRLCFSPSMMEDIIANAAREVTIHGRKEHQTITLGGDRVYTGTGGAAVQTLDMDTHEYRPSSLQDIYDSARLVDQLEHISWFSRNCVPTELPDLFELDINTAYAMLKGTSKPVGMSFVTGDHVGPVIEMVEAVTGKAGQFRHTPFLKAHITSIVSPLRYGEDAFDVMLGCLKHGVPINAIIAAQCGATAPAPLAGMLAQSNAETLATLAMVNVFEPGFPVIFSNWPFVADLRTGSFSGGGPEIAVLNACAAQLGRYYDLPTGVSSSMSDAKSVDAQMGAEKGLTALSATLAGANAVYESAGMMASLLGTSFAALVLDNDMLGSIQRMLRGMEVNEATLGFDVIRQTVEGDGHFLGQAHTLEAMERDFFYPEFADRAQPIVWLENGRKDAWQRAEERARAILEGDTPVYIDNTVDRLLRERFPIRL